VERGVSIVANAQEEHSTVEFIHAADGTSRGVGRNRKGTGSNCDAWGPAAAKANGRLLRIT
jgi:hypothetical protein